MSSKDFTDPSTKGPLWDAQSPQEAEGGLAVTHVIEQIISEYKRGKIDIHQMCREIMAEVDEEKRPIGLKYASTSWHPDDILTVAPDMSHIDAVAFLERFGRPIHDAMVACGWETIRSCLETYRTEKQHDSLF